MKIEFGIGKRGVLSGADVSVRAYQICSLLAAAYILIAANYPPVFMKGGAGLLLDLGVNALPRWEALLLSEVYRTTLSEIAVYFIMLGLALAAGLAAKRLLHPGSGSGRGMRIAFIVLIAADLVVRLLPLHFNKVFSLPVSVAGFAVRLACLALIVLDLRAEKK